MLKLLDEHRPAMEAERLLGLHSVFASAAGRMTQLDRQQFLRDLQKRAHGPQRVVPATEADLRTLPIKVVHEP